MCNIMRPTRPRPDAITRQELADALGERYHRVYFWTRKRNPPIVTPSYSVPEKRTDWFSPDDLEQLRRFFAALNIVQEFTGSRSPRGGRSRS